MSVLLSTTGTLGTVTISDLGNRTFSHPTTNYVLSDEYLYDEIRDSEDLGAALDSGYISITNDGQIVGNSSALRSVQPVQPTGGTTGGGTAVAGFTNVITVTDTGTQTNWNPAGWGPTVDAIIWEGTSDLKPRGIVDVGHPQGAGFAFINNSPNGKKIQWKKGNGANGNRLAGKNDLDIEEGEYVNIRRADPFWIPPAKR